MVGEGDEIVVDDFKFEIGTNERNTKCGFAIERSLDVYRIERVEREKLENCRIDTLLSRHFFSSLRGWIMDMCLGNKDREFSK